jgi:hypothetical protein
MSTCLQKLSIEKPVYTQKIDCFSFGVIIIQTITRQFPNPEDRRKEIQIKQPGLPPIVEVPVSEIERRQNHIGEIDPNHSLKQVTLDCLKDRDVERPSAQQLCERVAALKEDSQYSESVRVVEARSNEKDRELRSLRQQVQNLQLIIQSQTNHLVEKDQIISQKDETIVELRRHMQQLEREKILESEEKTGDHEVSRLKRQLRHVNQQLEESEQVVAKFQRRFTELEQLRPATDASSNNKEQRTSIKLTWREGEKAPCMVSKLYCAAVDGKTLYVRLTGTYKVFNYTISTSSWSQLPDSLTSSCPSVIINNLLTLVGGYYRAGSTLTNQLFSLTGEHNDRKWTEEFPPMPTKRQGSVALCTGTALVVAGGIKDESNLKVVELLNTETLQWSTAADLPQPLCQAPASICGDSI